VLIEYVNGVRIISFAFEQLAGRASRTTNMLPTTRRAHDTNISLVLIERAPAQEERTTEIGTQLVPPPPPLQRAIFIK